MTGSQATGADKTKLRRTNLMKLKVDTSYWTRYRSRDHNPDLDTSFVFPQAVPDLINKGPFPAIPRDDNDTKGDDRHIQAIANTAAFHFASIEQGGSSLYPTLAQKVTNPEVLAYPSQYRPDRNHALPDLAGQGGQRTSSDRSDQWTDVSRP